MMALRSDPRIPARGVRRPSGLFLTGLFLFFAPALAGAGDGGTRALNASVPGEEVVSLPVVDHTAGTTLVGHVRELRALVQLWHSSGRVDVERLGDGRFAVTFIGDHYLELDRAELARTNVVIGFRGGAPFAGGVAVLQVLDSDPVRIPAERVPLPFRRLAGVRGVQGNALSLEVFGGGRVAHAQVVTRFGHERVALFQTMR